MQRHPAARRQRQRHAGSTSSPTRHSARGRRTSSTSFPQYSNLIQGYQGLANSGLGSYFSDASFGFPSAQVNNTIKPRSDVTINYDQYGVPHIYGTTRSGTEFGAGFAGAQARLFVMDAFRHLGKGKLSSFAGGAAGNRLQEQNLWQVAPYTQADLDAQVAALEGQGTARRAAQGRRRLLSSTA